MCGIVGYIGKQRALPILLDGIKALEYRGYDSAGFAVLQKNGAIKSEKAVGRVAMLEQKIGDPERYAGTLGIIQSRWATHGGVTEANAHPHRDCSGNIMLVHNGIIENYKDLRNDLVRLGHSFRSETDTEVLAHLIEEYRNINPKLDFEEAVRHALLSVRGTYGFAILDSRDPGVLIAARNFSPLLLGIGDKEYFVASDASAVLKHTAKVVYLDDGEMAVLTPKNYTVYDLRRNIKQKNQEKLEWSLEEAQKGGYPHFMLKEIFEEPEAIENSIRGRMIPKEGRVKLGGLDGVRDRLQQAKRILISACGTAYLAGRVGENMIEEYAGIPAEVDVASEFRYRKPVFRDGDVFLAISQSGETADTLASLREAKEKGIVSLGIVNVVGSTLARETDAGVYQHVGPEIGVASTKAFTSQVAILALLTVLLGRQRDMSVVTGERILKELAKIPDLMRKIIAQNNAIEKLAKKYQKYENFLYLGRKYNVPVAYEGALKLKEISYVHAEGCGAGEMKHGPIAMIDKNFPSIFVAPQDSVYEKMISNMEEIRARGGPILAIATEGDKKIRDITDDVMYIPKTLEMLTPLLSVVPLQLFAYHFGVMRGYDVDKPRNLAKSVTVE
ncbi:MAG: glutamine--fructose-6-phosphate aminotransferase [Candidatus Sungbacteria bacterium RIFCSPLOWO2_01_FULL_47_10]|uniref:Glutamine--fructose-6-phosphate aminotransferase [isomerizing] n=1 Tax=Candidatus Sungbacteria bacterium RIFCSPLOWO2_01_FULL_47_10 TaxID=1802276 RepID=A0A1G2L4D8_9BACT|nr:MAG: glutamine--fructose-6-phosphate aminotransferase [Candidatus Sungbacteria bacterium RIFCSPLOWO2_01_FULL_47_10]